VVKLLVQIPCHNEEATLPLVLQSIPRSIPGIEEVRTLVIDDGCTDRTAIVARELGVDYIVAHSRNRGLAAAFQTGLDACLQLGADIIVNTDGDNQYPQADIPRLIQPILEGRADMVVGDRQVGSIQEFPPRKRLLQKLGSWTVRRFSGAQVADAPSGFRAFTREVAERLNVVSTYSYTLETLIQAGRNRMTIANIQVKTNATTRESRLMSGMPDYVTQSARTMLRSYAMYEPLRSFLVIGAAAMLIGLGFAAHWAYFRYFQEAGQAKLQSFVLAAALLVIGFQIWVMGLLASLVGVNRRLLEQLLYRVKRIERVQVPSNIQHVTTDEEPAKRPEAYLVR
jgi:glycosyltransferase involved in cell wall biosynthesis